MYYNIDFIIMTQMVLYSIMLFVAIVGVVTIAVLWFFCAPADYMTTKTSRPVKHTRQEEMQTRAYWAWWLNCKCVRKPGTDQANLPDRP